MAGGARLAVNGPRGKVIWSGPNSPKRKKTGVFTGAYAINPVSQEKIPIWIADYVLVGYGTAGAIQEATFRRTMSAIWNSLGNTSCQFARWGTATWR